MPSTPLEKNFEKSFKMKLKIDVIVGELVFSCNKTAIAEKFEEIVESESCSGLESDSCSGDIQITRWAGLGPKKL